uniref:Thioredoxin domain-containing protein n=1 Tax=Haptolina brevifila TaxID=156173 RepID=A0A7S2DDS9_9EUKA|mmetsp:Transcript_36976/g.73824  ORF Transcript_36976/g.73824 Transcript_36976/m.73824 type:complete len:192 (+) Transcript_36976:8-583(+)
MAAMLVRSSLLCSSALLLRTGAAVNARRLNEPAKMKLSPSELPIVDAAGSSVDLVAHASGKRVALYFAAGWCPMCLTFETALAKYRADADAKGLPIECIMVSSDRSASAASDRAAALDMVQVVYEGSFREALKRHFQVWAGSEAMQLGFGRRSGVPALVVLSKEGEEVAFLDAERNGAAALEMWPKSGTWE